MKLGIYEIHIFELRNKEINVKKILAVTYCEDLLYIYFNNVQLKNSKKSK